MDQQTLWHESLSDALKDAVNAIGGPKEVAAMLWPAKEVTQARTYLLNCLDDSRNEKLALDEVEMIIREAANHKCHTPMFYMSREYGYKEPETVDPETEVERMRREMQQTMQQLQSQMQVVEKQLGRLDNHQIKAVA